MSFPSVSVFNLMDDLMPLISRRAAVWFIVAVVAGSASSFSQHKPEVPPTSALPSPALNRLTIARVGPWIITGTEFKLSYEFGPAFVKRERDSKLRYLKYMINEKLLALDGLDRGLDQWPDLRSQVSEIEGDLATEELYRADVLKKVHISDKRLAGAIEQDRIHLSVQWLFLSSAKAVDEVVKEMKSNVPFDTLFAQQLERGAKLGDRFMETTKFRITTKNPLLAEVIDTMRVGSVSLPIHGPDGWYIVRMIDKSIDPVITQSDWEKLREDVQRSLTQQLSDSLSDRYVQTLITARKPTILREPFNAIEAHLGKIYLDKEKYDAWQLKARKGAADLADINNLEPIAMEALVAMNKGVFTVRDFLDWFRMREPYATLALSSQEAFFQSAEQLVWRMVRDRLLTQRAYARGFQNHPAVKRGTQWWKEKFLYTANKHRIGDTIADSLPVLQKYYDDNKKSFTDEKGNVKDFATVRGDVWKQYYAFELTKRTLHEILRLRQKYTVKIDESILKSIPVEDQNEPKTIDVYAVKKGGTYPHTAFPSIDYDWQTWE